MSICFQVKQQIYKASAEIKKTRNASDLQAGKNKYPYSKHFIFLLEVNSKHNYFTGYLVS